MLVIGRRPGEKFYILVPNTNDVLEVKVSSFKGGNVRIAIMAPEEYKIVRGEIYEGKQQEMDNLEGRTK